MSLPRQSFHRKEPSLSVYQTTPITKHYQVSYSILNAFDTQYRIQNYSVAYALGLQFCEMALLEIPKHGYYYSKRHERERMESSLEAVRVTRLLKELQDQYLFLETSLAEEQRVDRLAELALIQVERASEDQYEGRRAQTERDFRSSTSWMDCAPLLLAFQDSITTVLCPNREEVMKPVVSDSTTCASDAGSSTTPTMPLQLREPEQDQRTCLTTDLRSDSSDDLNMALVSPPKLERHDNESFRRIRQPSADEAMLQKALYLSGLELTPNVVFDNGPQQQQQHEDIEPRPPPSEGQLQRADSYRQSSALQFDTVAKFYQEDFLHFKQTGRIRVSFADTYQGRVPGSTNGCTVIAPLLCIHHFLNDEHPDPGLPDFIILQVIDEETPVILSQLREQLGLSAQAFLIPSDAHDYLIANGQLSQQQFITVVGGNILDDQHLHAFVRALEECPRQKVAATLFFHEHVIAILKVRRDASTCWYDLIDGLPLRETLGGCSSTGSLSLSSSQELLSEDFLPKTARVRCLNAEALTACLRWYACSKFSEDNVSYIDQYAWDDASCDFDPRVFQGFVWGSNDQ